jgi:hypothetical protein
MTEEAVCVRVSVAKGTLDLAAVIPLELLHRKPIRCYNTHAAVRRYDTRTAVRCYDTYTAFRWRSTCWTLVPGR